jgi:hypothetical protein
MFPPSLSDAPSEQGAQVAAGLSGHVCYTQTSTRSGVFQERGTTLSIGKRLAAAIGSQDDRSLRNFSRRVGIPYRTLQNYIGGERSPSSESLGIICTQTNIDGHWLLTGEGDMLRQGIHEEAEAYGATGAREAARTSSGNMHGEHPGLDHRLAELRALLEGLKPDTAELILSDALARARTAARIDELVRIVADLQSREDKRQS